MECHLKIKDETPLVEITGIGKYSGIIGGSINLAELIVDTVYR